MAKPISTGMANRKIIVVPCSENAWLYCSADSTFMPGRMVWVRIVMAIPAPITKNTSEAMM